jgi:DNA-binding transcriptional LysR family regulator
MRFKGLDLNLLVALDALLDERSVTRAAERLHISQPAMSGALSRLREYFRDDLLVAVGKRMYPTACAEGLLPQIKTTLRALDAMVGSTAFDAATSTRTFRIVGSDYALISLLARLVAELSELAPGIKLDLLPTDDESTQHLADGKVDLLLIPDTMAHPDHPTEMLVEEKHVIVGWNGNPLFKKGITEEDFLASGHVATSFGRQRLRSFGDLQLARLGKERRIEVTSGSFGNVPWLLIGTMRLALMHQRMAQSVSRYFPLSISPVPFEFPLMREVAQHHSARTSDLGLSWLREQLRAAAGNSGS